MAKNLQMIFSTVSGVKTSMTISDAKQDLDEQTVRTAMETMINCGAFATTKGDAYAAAVSASYVETIETEVFNDAAPAA